MHKWLVKIAFNQAEYYAGPPSFCYAKEDRYYNSTVNP